jgi:hypothetical protein
MKTNIVKKFLGSPVMHASASPAFRNSTGPINSPGMMGNKPGGWNANGTGSNMPSTKPYVILISNTSAAAVSNFDILGAAQYLTGTNGGGTWSSAGNFTYLGITVSMGTPGVSYQQFLSNTQTSPFTGGAIYAQTLSGSNSQVTSIITLTSTSPQGAVYTEPLIPLISPNQFQTGIVTMNSEFNVDGLTKLTFTTIYASTVWQVLIYPAQVISPAAILNNQPGQQRNPAPRPFGTLQ